MCLKSIHVVAPLAAFLACSTIAVGDDADSTGYDAAAAARAEISAMNVGAGDWPQFFGWTHRNNTPQGENIPAEWDVDSGRNILWSAPLGTQTFGNAVVANGKVFVGTNDGNGYISGIAMKRTLSGCTT